MLDENKSYWGLFLEFFVIATIVSMALFAGYIYSLTAFKHIGSDQLFTAVCIHILLIVIMTAVLSIVMTLVFRIMNPSVVIEPLNQQPKDSERV